MRLRGMEAPRQGRVAHTLDVDVDARPVVRDKHSKIPLLLRQHAADKFFEALKKTQPDPAPQAALDLELQLYRDCGKSRAMYKQSLLSRLSAVGSGKMLKSMTSAPPVVSNLRVEEVTGRLRELLVPAEQLRWIGFLSARESVRVARLAGQEQDCSRCQRPFIPDTYYAAEDPEPCRHHYGRLQSVRNAKGRLYSCCGADDQCTTPCTVAPKHVFVQKTLFEDEPVVCSADFPPAASQLEIAALDGEMCHTEAGLELCRLTMVSWDEERILDIMVQPRWPIVDYNTRFSGVSEAHFAPGGFNTVVPAGLERRVYAFDELVGTVLPRLIGPETILVGHSLENDLFQMRLDHPRIIDTSVLYPHSKGPPYRMALRDLARVHLRQFVQEGSAGHDSYEDCVACLRLLKRRL